MASLPGHIRSIAQVAAQCQPEDWQLRVLVPRSVDVMEQLPNSIELERLRGMRLKNLSGIAQQWDDSAQRDNLSNCVGRRNPPQ